MSYDDGRELKVVAGRHSIDLARRICEHIDIPLGKARTDVFPDGELISFVEEDVRGRDTFVVLSTAPPMVNESLVELLIMADSLRRASAHRITAVIPYFGYARQDRKERGRTPITAKLVANMITTSGFDRVVTLDLHAAQIQGFFDLPLDHLSSMPVFGDHLIPHRDELGDLVVASPDIGNVKIANLYAEMLDAELAIIEKRRVSGSAVKAANIVGAVKDKTILLVDDMISTAGTICEASRVLKDRGAGKVFALATHGLFVGPAIERLEVSPIEKIFVTNTIPFESRIAPIRDRVQTLCVGKLFADAIDHIHHNKSISALFTRYAQSKRQ
ncbi:MAG: ribose-phosphate pyrophosphokinase [Phycisphaerales bacterium]